MSRCLRSAVLISALLGATATSATALTWTTPKELPGRELSLDGCGPPPIEINRRGDVVVAWAGNGPSLAIGSRTRALKRIDLPGRSEFCSDLGGGSLDFAVAPDGKARVISRMDFSDTVTYAIVSPSGKATRARVLDTRRKAGATAVAAQPDGSFIVLYQPQFDENERDPGLQAHRIGASGKPGRVTRLGVTAGDFLVGFASAPDGRIIACCRKAGGRRAGVWRYSPARGWSTTNQRLGAREDVVSVATAAGTYLVRTTDRSTNRDTLHTPRGKLSAPPFFAKSSTEPYGMGGLTGRGLPLTFSAQDDQLFASMNGAPPVALGGYAVSDNPWSGPISAPFGTGTLVAWINRGRWAVATEQNGAFKPAAAPGGSADYAGMAAAGDAAALAWYDGHRAFVSFAKP